jgi:hypothetical protein
VGDIQVEDVRLDDEGVHARLLFYASGEQEEDRAFYEYQIRGEAIATIGPEGEVGFEVREAEIVREMDAQN